MELQRALAFARANRSRAVERLLELVRIPSVSADPARASDVVRCAQRLAGMLRTIGMHEVRLAHGARHPVVVGTWRGAGDAPTLMVYGHYDVQPAEPLARWHTPPFEPAVRDGAVYGRGSSDDKGQLLVHVCAIEAWLHGARTLPVNVVCLFEGEEEIGSLGLSAVLRDPRYRADAAVASDSPMRARGTPALTYALRGMLSLEVSVQTGARELHSGVFGGAAKDAIQAVCGLIASMSAPNGDIAIPGFYRTVRPIDASERALLAAGPSDAEMIQSGEMLGVDGEPGYTLYERTTIRPSFAASGIVGGYAGKGVKAVVPAAAMAKLTFRLVPDQDPEAIADLVRAHVARAIPRTLQTRVRVRGRGIPLLFSMRTPAVRAAASALEAAFGVSPSYLRCGGTIPSIATIVSRLGVEPVLMGFALPDDGMHGPNERFLLDNLFRGTEASVRFLHQARAGLRPSLGVGA